MYFLEETYWSKEHPRWDDYDRLYKELVPRRGPADTIGGEALRAISNVYYDHNNNGSCNARTDMSRKLVALSDRLGEFAQKQIQYIHEKLVELDRSSHFTYMDSVLGDAEIRDYEEALEDVTTAIVDYNLTFEDA